MPFRRQGWLPVVVLLATGCGSGSDGARVPADGGAISDAAAGPTCDSGRACGVGPDGAPVPPDARAISDAAGPTCEAGQACAVAEPCKTGVTACEPDGRQTCVVAGPALDGTDCGGGMICDHGACVAPCADGLTRCSGTCVDLATSNDHCSQCGMACDAAATCTGGTCEPGRPLSGTGACTYIDQPGWLSCPTGMSCRCYYNYERLFEDQPAEIDLWLTDATLEVLGGSIPSNETLSGVTPATLPLISDGASGKTGSAYPYTATVSSTGAVEVKIHATSGYIPPSYILTSSEDCGNRGKILECTFAPH